jgi:RNA polymerase sigma-70 factor (ECF subfamily)
MTRDEERNLIERARRGDRAAAEALIRAQQQSLFAYMLRMSGRHDVAEDITQEAFVRALANLDRFDTRYRFSTWLFTIAKRLHMNLCDRRRPIFDTDALTSWRCPRPRAEHSAGLRDGLAHVRDELQAGLEELPARQREILILFHQQDWPIALIARHLNMPEGTVKSHLHRGRRRLRALLSSQQDQLAGEVYLEA